MRSKNGSRAERPALRVAAAGGVFALALGTLSTVGSLGGDLVATADPTCSPAGTTGLTAALVATANQTVTGTVDATGCNIGIYVGAAVTGVTINQAEVSGANDHGILAEETSNLTIENSTIEGNGVNRTAGIDTDKAVLLVGVTDSSVTGNTVKDNTADGGISVTDAGAGVDPGAPAPGPQTPFPSSNVTVSNNTVENNYGGCGIIVEAWAPGAPLSDITVSGNTITGSPGQFGPHGPVIGQIVVATDAPGTAISGTIVSGNTVTGSFVSGITVHSNAPGDSITGTQIENNTLSGNNWGLANGAPQTDAIALEVNAIPAPATPVLSGTSISGNSMTEQVGVWQTWQVTGTTLSGNHFTGTTLLYTQPAPGLGYWLTASDGGVFSFGQAAFYGSTGNLRLSSPVVGLAQTRDQGGYLLAGADGGVFTYGDANFFGSVPASGTKATAPIVGIATTPMSNAAPGQPGTNGLGYWLVGSDGNVYAFGPDAKSFGSTAGVHLSKPVVDLAPTPDGLGYWLVATDGGVFSYGDAAFYGSTGNLHLNKPIVGMAATPDGGGYWLMASDGGVFSFGDAGFFGSTGNLHLNAPVVAAAAEGVLP